MIHWPYRVALGLLLCVNLLGALTACTRTAGQPTAVTDNRLQVVATTTVVGDVVRVVGGDAIQLWTLLPVGAEPHSHQLAPSDVARLTKADLLFINGFDLEEGLLNAVRGSAPAVVVAVSDGVEPLAMAAEGSHAEEGAQSAGAGEEHTGLDPHTWTDPNNVIRWVENIAQALSAADPANAERYRANAAAYITELQALDKWIVEQVAQIPPAERLLITDHAVFGYFVQRYGFTQAGAVMTGFSTLAEPSAQELAALEDAIRSLGVRAIFVGSTVNPALAERVAGDTGVALAQVYSDSLSAVDGPAATYLDYMRYNVQTFVQGLRGD